MKIKQCPVCKEYLPEYLIIHGTDICYKCISIDDASNNIKKVSQGENQDDTKK